MARVDAPPAATATSETAKPNPYANVSLDDAAKEDARELAVGGQGPDVAAGVPVGVVTARFHNGLADATAQACVAAASSAGVGVAILSGGVFANRLLLSRTTDLLDRAGLRVLVPRRLPPGDGGISYGQAAVAAARP